MTEDQSAKNLRISYGIFMIAVTLLVGAAFIFECSDLYFAEGAYTRESAAERLMSLMLPVSIWLAAAVVGAFISMACPAGKRKTRPDRTAGAAALLRRVPDEMPENLRKKLHISRVLKIFIRLACFAAVAAAAVVSLVYLLNTAHFAAGDLQGEVLAMLKAVLPCVAIAFAAMILLLAGERAIAVTETAAIKSAVLTGSIVLNKTARSGRKFSPRSRAAALWSARAIVAAAGLAFFIIGIFDGGQMDVFVKAAKICTECIGLG